MILLRGRMCVFKILITFIKFPHQRLCQTVPPWQSMNAVSASPSLPAQCVPWRFESEKMKNEIHCHLTHISFSMQETEFNFTYFFFFFNFTYLKTISIYFSVNYPLLFMSFAHFSNCLLVLFFLIFILRKLDPCLFWLFVLE